MAVESPSSSVSRPTNRGRIFAAMAKMASATFLSRILGLIREQLMAAFFGAGAMMDIFLVAYRIPNILRDLFAESNFTAAFLPIFTEERQKDPQAARRLLWSTFCLLGLITLLVSGLIFIFAPQIVGFLAPSYQAFPAKMELAVLLTRIMAPLLVLVSIAALWMGALNTLKVFFLPALGPFCSNVMVISAILFLVPLIARHGQPPIIGVAVGVLLGGLTMGLIQLPALIRLGQGFLGPIKLWTFNTKRIVARMGLGSMAVAASEINVIINTMLATSIGVGAVSWLNYAFRVFQLPVGVFGIALANSNLVHFADHWKAGRKTEALECLQVSYVFLWAILLPSAIFLAIFAQPLFHLLFERGHFDWSATEHCAEVFCIYLLGLPAYGIYKVTTPVFYVLDKPKLPVFTAIFSIAVNSILCVTLAPRYGVFILAAGIALTAILNASWQLLLLVRHLALGRT
ncbi:MAG: murein biosynthesis integral membrane protein MurJ, partial [Bacteriovoracaceae bacterium]|nr:murein biosynthesis integral membrane protein MurJ [Bacteriovoracaceae bacterium]